MIFSAVNVGELLKRTYTGFDQDKKLRFRGLNRQMFNTSISGGLLKRNRNINNNNKLQVNDRPRESIGSRNSKLAKESFSSTNDKRLTINVSGIKFQTWQSTLLRFPNSLLGRADAMREFYDDQRNEYFLDRDPYLFKFVLNYYRFWKITLFTGRLPRCVRGRITILWFFNLRRG